MIKKRGRMQQKIELLSWLSGRVAGAVHELEIFRRGLNCHVLNGRVGMVPREVVRFLS
jgi:hypothetical protein